MSDQIERLIADAARQQERGPHLCEYDAFDSLINAINNTTLQSDIKAESE